MISALFKRLFDLLGSIAGLVLAGPMMVVIAVLIKFESPGPVFYRGIRAGPYGKPFEIFKFRTMIDDAESKGGPSTALNDVRLTRIGKFFRKYKLDELPQLINIFLGDMSFVGPRPQVERYTKLYGKEEMRILSVKPGLTDFASLKYIDMDKVLGDCNVDEKYMKEIEPDKNMLRLKYADERSMWIDLKIIFLTIVKLLNIRLTWNTKNSDQQV